MIPSFLIPVIRMDFTIDQLANFTNYTNGETTVTAFTIKIIQITYQLIDFGKEFQNMIMPMPEFFIKSTGWNNCCISVPYASSGSQCFVLNQWFA